ncbi:MAG: MATE family efflux transporter [Thermoanaerobaculia bacterium]
MSESLDAPAVARPSRSITWATVREAVRGTHQDYTEGPIGRAIVLLAVPMVLEMGLESVFAVTDVFWVSRLGADAVAAVGITESLMTIIYAVAIGLSMAATATVARRIGEKNREGASVAAVQVIALGAVFSAALGVTGAVFARPLLERLGASPGVIATGTGYAVVMLAGNATVFLLYLINAVFRGAGDASIAMRVLWLGNGINIVLDPCLIFGLGPFPEMGVTGGAVANNIGRGVAVLWQLALLARGTERISIRRRHLKLEPSTMTSLLRLSGSGILQVTIGTASWLGLIRILTGFGSAAVAGYTIGIRIIMFAILPSWGLSNAAATLVGQNLGARRPDRAERSVWIAAFYNAVVLGVVGAAFVALAGPIVRLFTTDPAIVPFGIACLRTVSYGFVFYAYGMIFEQAFNGAGDTWTPAYLNLLCFWLWEIPLAWFLATRANLGPLGVFVAIAVAFSTLAVVSGLVFRRGRWKLKKV